MQGPFVLKCAVLNTMKWSAVVFNPHLQASGCDVWSVSVARSELLRLWLNTAGDWSGVSSPGVWSVNETHGVRVSSGLELSGL